MTTTKSKPKNTKVKSAAARREHLLHAVHHTAHMLSEQGPMNITFVHNNTLLGLQKQHFHDAIETARATIGVNGYQPDYEFIEAFARGRITDADLDESLAAQPDTDAGDVLIKTGERVLTRGDLIKAALRSDAVPIRALAALESAFDPEAGMFDLGPEGEQLAKSLAETGPALIAEIRDCVGVQQTLGEWLGAHFALPVMRIIEETCAAGSLPTGALRGVDALAEMGIPAERHESYLARAGELWGDKRDDALGVEAQVVAHLVERLFFRRGTLDAIIAGLSEAPTCAALRALRAAILIDLGMDEPLGALDPNTLGPRVGFHMHAGPARPLSIAECGLLDRLLDGAAENVDTEMAAELRRARAHALLPDVLLPQLHKLAESISDKALKSGVHNLAAEDAQAAFASACAQAADDLAKAPSKGRNLSDIVQELTGIDLAAKVNMSMIGHLAAFTDEGLAGLRMPDRNAGLFSAWRQVASADPLLIFEAGANWRADLAALPEDAGAALIAMLDRLGVAEEDWEAFLGRSLAQLRGWGGMMFWLETHPNHYKQKVHPADTIQYLAIRLFTEIAVAERILEEVCAVEMQLPALFAWAQANAPELLLRRALHQGALDPQLGEEASLVLSMRPPSRIERLRIEELAQAHWQMAAVTATRVETANIVARVQRVAAQLGLIAKDFTATPGLADSLQHASATLTPQKISRIWMEAYEIHYRDEVLNALAQNRDRGRWIHGRDRRPRAQLVLCIDEREENVHRYFGELDPDYETLGAAGFFGVAIAHSALGEHAVTPLCPAVATPAHRMAEVPRDEALDTAWPVAKRRKALVDAFGAVMWETKRNPAVAFLTTQITGLAHAVPLIGRVFAPLGFHRLTETAVARVIPKVATRLTHAKTDSEALERLGLHGEALPYGFDAQEGADRIEAQLRNWGLTYCFARIVIICAHRSYSVNNPHENAHDCGACGGKAGGPNARLFAALANDPHVREVLRARGIDIPEDTWFVGAEHNTCNDDIPAFDTDDIPAALRDDWELIRRDLDETSRRAARERCRRFRSAPKDASPAKSWEHVRGRSQDLSQVRPEWGHATNAFALVGRRALTQGLFFDRRGFIISYDPTQDSDGSILERILLAVGPVGAGINLEYYFSTVNPDGFGSGTKVPHNVVGMVGVMPGAKGDLATGLPRQMTEVHEAMRLQLIVDAPLAVLGEIYGRQPGIQELLDGQWVHLIAHVPEDGSFHRFVPGVGFVEWRKPLTDLPEVANSYEWIRGKHDCFLPPARIREPQVRWDAADN